MLMLRGICRRRPWHPGISIVSSAGLHGVMAEIDRTALEGSQESLVQGAIDHHETLVALHRVTAILPMTFGQGFSSVAALAGVLADRRRPLEEELDRIDGHSEYSIVLRRGAGGEPASSGGATPEPRASSGTDFLRARSRQRSAIRREKADLSEAAETLRHYLDAIAARTLPQRRRADHVELTVLHARDATARLSAAIANVGRAHRDIEISLRGPWPPYSFVDLGAIA